MSVAQRLEPWALVGLGALWLAVVASALAVVQTSHHSRLLFNQLETLRREETALQVAWGQYLLEQSTWGAYHRVEQLANDELTMSVPAPEQVEMVP